MLKHKGKAEPGVWGDLWVGFIIIASNSMYVSERHYGQNHHSNFRHQKTLCYFQGSEHLPVNQLTWRWAAHFYFLSNKYLLGIL